MNNTHKSDINFTRLQFYFLIAVGLLGFSSRVFDNGHLKTLLITLSGSIFIPTLTTNRFIQKLHQKGKYIDTNRSLLGLIVGVISTGIFFLILNTFSYLMGQRSIYEISVYLLLAVITGGFVGFLIIFVEERQIRFISENILQEQ